MFLDGVRSVWALLVGVALLSLGNGLQGTLLGVRAAMEDFTPGVTGIIMAAYSVGLLIGSVITPKLVSYVGHIRVFSALASVASTAALAFPVFVDPYWWGIMRVILGFCLSGLFIVAESWLNAVSTNQDRGRLLSVYMIITYSCMGFGQFLLNAASPGGFVLFVLVSCTVSLAMVPMALVQLTAPDITRPRGVKIREIYSRSPLAVVCAFANGLGQSAFFTMGAVYGTLAGLTVAEVSILMALPPLGVILSQYPIGLFSDRHDRRSILTLLAFAAALLAIGCVPAAGLSKTLLITIFCLFGALALPLYSVALAHANDNLDADQILGASGKLVLIYGCGSVVGPVLVGGIMSALGAVGFPIYLAAVYALMGAFAIYRMSRRAAPPNRSDFVLVNPRMTPVLPAAVISETEYGV
ncbi:MFS transporter [Rhodoligotrophos appendicifer]|uniref:MFS transporter n=1 Tax=Rhodoligotrophos appendicifer TaxID=987056 RepID=UPI001FE583F6|nr:MFS transporter [Rhodoligotrophos appendicifer]